MPRDKQPRGRRATQKRPRDDHGEHELSSSKRRRGQDDFADPAPDFVNLDLQTRPGDEKHEQHGLAPQGKERPFYGLLDEQEHEYFKNADQLLELNQFHDASERELFIQNVHKEAGGKELKLACQQSGSRLLERLILLSTSDQLKNLFRRFEGEYIHLMSHRFASHCCERLFLCAATAVEEELATRAVSEDGQAPQGVENLLMQDLFLNVLNEIADDLGFMITDSAASHSLRVLLIVFSGKPLSDPQHKSLSKSQHKRVVSGKRKENISIVAANSDLASYALPERTVPTLFVEALQRIVNQSVATLDTTALRSFATQACANPTLQILLEVELTLLGKHRGAEQGSIIKRLLPDEPLIESSESAKFVNGILFDTVGSHLLQTIVQYAPGKTFKSIYRVLIKDRIGSLARNNLASYVVCQCLERLGPHDLHDAAHAIIAEIPSLAERNRFNVLKVLAERMVVRKADVNPLADALKAAYPSSIGSLSLPTLLRLPDTLPDLPTSAKFDSPLHIGTAPAQNAASVFVQSLLKLPGPLSVLVFDALSQLEFKHVRCIAHTSPLSPILQTALSAETATTMSRRKLITHFYGAIAEFSLSPSASHVIDAVEVATRKDLAFVRERIAEELSESEAALRESPCGRKVWRNWKMDFYQRDRDGWIRETRQKTGNNGFQSLPGLLGSADAAAKERGEGKLGRVIAATTEGAKAAVQVKSNVHQNLHEQVCQPIKDVGKTALDRARERYAQTHKSAPAVSSSQSRQGHQTI